MGRDEVEDVAEDGGWGEMIDHGHDLAEYMLDTPHPYDLHGHKPADRWGTRQQLASKRFADPGSLLDEGELAAGRPIVSSGRARPPRPAAASRKPVRTPPSQTARGTRSGAKTLGAMKKLGVAPLKDNTKGRQKAARAALAARRLDMDPGDVVAVSTCGLPSKQIAALLGTTLEQVKAIHRAYAAAASPTGQDPSSRSTSKSASPASATKPPGRGKRSPTRRDRSRPSLLDPLAGSPVVRRPLSVPSIPGCASCGAPIGVNGRCQCS